MNKGFEKWIPILSTRSLIKMIRRDLGRDNRAPLKEAGLLRGGVAQGRWDQQRLLQQQEQACILKIQKKTELVSTAVSHSLENQAKGGKIDFGPWFHRFCPMVGWLYCLGPEVKLVVSRQCVRESYSSHDSSATGRVRKGPGTDRLSHLLIVTHFLQPTRLHLSFYHFLKYNQL